jgi:hypothetical protein
MSREKGDGSKPSFIFGFCILLRLLSRLLEVPSLATILKDVYFIAATCFGPCWPSSGGIHNYFQKLFHLQRIRCFVLLDTILIYLVNSAVVC